MKTTNIVLTYITTIEKELHPAIYGIKAYATKYIKHQDVRIHTKSIRASHFAQSSRFALYPSFSDDEAEHIVASIVKKHPKFVGFSTYVWNVEATLLLARLIKKLDPTIEIILGGAEATYNAKKILLKEKYVDIIVLDEGEKPFLQLIEGDPRDHIPGIMYRKGGKIVHNPHTHILDLSTVPSPYLLGQIRPTKGNNTAYIIETSRGCPFKCAYCSYNINNYAKLRLFPVERVNQELTLLLSREVKVINIVDDNFNIYDRRAQQILNEFIMQNKKTYLELFVRADAWSLSPQLTTLLSNKYIHSTIGIQALKPTTLRTTQRIHKRETLEHNLQLLNKSGARYTLQFIIGLPGDTYQDIKTDIDWAYSFHPTFIHLQTLRINPGTLFEREAQKFGITYGKTPPYVINKTSSMSAKDLKKSEELNIMFKLFYEAGFLKNTIERLHATFSAPISVLMEELLSAGIKPVTLFMNSREHLVPLVQKYLKRILKKYNRETQLSLFEESLRKDLSLNRS